MPDQSGANWPTSERRTLPRHQVLFSFVELENDNGGIILNLSERGLAMQVVRSLANESLLLDLRFQLSQSTAWIEARGRITWRSLSAKTAGVEFVGFHKGTQIRIKKWISSLEQPSTPAKENPLEKIAVDCSPDIAQSESAVAIPEPEMIGHTVEDEGQDVLAEDPIEVTARAGETRRAEAVSRGSAVSRIESSVNENPGQRKSSPVLSFRKPYRFSSAKSGRRMRVEVLAALSLLAFILIVFHFRTLANHWQAREFTVAAKGLPPPAKSSANPASPPVDLSFPAERPGFVLQVGAMAHKENADRLVESLREKNFPADVSQAGTGHLYRVFVGPYPNIGSASQVAKELRKQGLDAIGKQWNSSAQ